MVSEPYSSVSSFVVMFDVLEPCVGSHCASPSTPFNGPPSLKFPCRMSRPLPTLIALLGLIDMPDLPPKQVPTGASTHKSAEATNDPLIADHRNFYKVEKWTKDGSKVDHMLYAGS